MSPPTLAELRELQDLLPNMPPTVLDAVESVLKTTEPTNETRASLAHLLNLIQVSRNLLFLAELIRPPVPCIALAPEAITPETASAASLEVLRATARGLALAPFVPGTEPYARAGEAMAIVRAAIHTKVRAIELRASYAPAS